MVWRKEALKDNVPVDQGDIILTEFNTNNSSANCNNDDPESGSSSVGGDSSSSQYVVHYRMASMQSPRTQCCCCAIGVFAAMFGIFMLSAGICIVLNVNYMEVDTSGLPPDLHNDDGKKIVGIILICIAICTLGLSATVSIIYFALCNGSTPRHAVTSSSAHANHSNGNVQSSSSLSSPANNTHHQYPNNKHVSKVAAMHGVKIGGGSGGKRGTPPGSQASLNSSAKQRRQIATSPSGALVPAPSHSQSPSAGSKRGRRNMQKKAKTHQRLRNRSFAMPTHTEEDSEAAKSVVDLKSHYVGPSAENSSNSGSSMAPSQIGSTIADDSRNGPNYSTTSFINPPPNTKASPVIIINEPTSPNSPRSLKYPTTSPTNGESQSSLTKEENRPSTVDHNSDNSLENCDRIAGDSVVFYNENEITRTTENVVLSSSSSPYSSSTPVPLPISSSTTAPPPSSSSIHTSARQLVSMVNSNSNEDSYSYSNLAFQSDNPNVSNTSVSLDHDTSECTDDSPTPPVNDRFSPPLKQHQPPPHPSSSSTSSTASFNIHNTAAFPQYPGTQGASNNTYPTPLMSAGLSFGDDSDLQDPSPPASDQDSFSSGNHHILQVQPHHQQQDPSSLSDPTVIKPETATAAAPDPSENRSNSDGDLLSELPQSSRHNDRYNHSNSNRGQFTVNISNNNVDNLENRSESRSSFNSTFSTDTEDKDDMVRMQAKMKELLN